LLRFLQQLIQLIEIKIKKKVETPLIQKERIVSEKVLIFGKDA
jgi:hypothetical protein